MSHHWRSDRNAARNLSNFDHRVKNRVIADRVVTASRGLNGNGMMLL